MARFRADQLTLTSLKPHFSKEYSIQLENKLIIKGLSNSAMKSVETMHQLLTTITKTMAMVVTEESYETFEGKPAEPQNDLEGGMSLNVVRDFIIEVREDMVILFKMQLFRAMVPAEIRHIVYLS
jgi:hypothetical protein